MEFSITKKSEGSRLIYEINGNVDEDANFVAPDVGASAYVTLDLEKISAINSVGIREWIKWIKMFPPSVKLAVRRCPKIIVDQINMVAGFLPSGTTIESFYVPYYSDSTGNEKMVLFENGKEFRGSEIFAPVEVKDDSGEIMEMDVIEAKYFKFLHA